MTDSDELRELADELEDEKFMMTPEITVRVQRLRRIADRLEAMETRPVVLAQRDSTESNVKEPK